VVHRDDSYSSVVNLSEVNFSDAELRVLSKGLKFTPLPPTVDRLQLRESIQHF
jgi:hypothetical protein